MKRKSRHDFLAGGGALGALMRAKDWSATPLGPMEAWPESLRSALSICLGSRFPIVIYWGPARAVLYNDAYSEILGRKHPWALGRPCREVWAEIWGVIAPMFDSVVETGEATWSEDQLLVLERRGYPEECYFSFSFSPVRGARGEVEGIFTAVIENTRRLLGERRMALLNDLAARNATARTAREACDLAMQTLESSPQDVPFALAYLDNGAGEELQCCTSGAQEALAAAPPELVREVPLPGTTAAGTAGRVVIGLNPRLAVDGQYVSFIDLVVDQIATAVANARAYEQQRSRAEALAEVDRAKTAFFSNVSHEFRTPLTLMLGPLEEGLGDTEAPLPPAQRERLELARRNALRLQKLVNTLLDFSRIEAGRAQARYVPTQLGAVTTDLASSFRSAIEKAGLRLIVDCPALPDLSYVDRDMWEKIVLNLLSNAFKFTFVGEIAVTLRQKDGRAELSVRDTGTGIPTDELPRVFERFHRVEGARSRSHEGTGIGLALVKELVNLHGGTIEVESAPGAGATFTVSIPQGRGHLPGAVVGAESASATALRPEVFVEEALRWLPDAPVLADGAGKRARILVADDNADLREYVTRLLKGEYHVETVADGQSALAAARARKPDLVLTDMMMPGLDGFGLIRELRADPELRTVPVIVLSARAGEEARLEGLGRGADDYLVKPFSARELMVRVESLLRSAAIRREASDALWLSEAALREADRRKDEFLAMLSHELRNPLAPIHNAVSLLGEADDEPPVRAQARGILERQVAQLTRLIDDLLDIARISRGSISLRREIARLDEIVAGAIETSRPLIEDGSHQLYVDLPQDPIWVSADRVRLTQVISNLLNNAARYTPSGGRIDVSARAAGGELAISVRDDGIGIEPGLLQGVFDMFVQAGNGPGHAAGGLGIGLALARQLVELHGGSIEARSDGAGRGSEFTVRVPLPIAPVLDRAAERRDAPQSARRVLIADDNVDAAQSLGLLLRRMGHAVQLSYDGAAALEAALREPPEIVLLDIDMPNLDGFAVAARLRADRRFDRVPIVALTGMGQELDRKRSRQAGFDEHVLKPVDYSALRRALALIRGGDKVPMEPAKTLAERAAGHP